MLILSDDELKFSNPLLPGMKGEKDRVSTTVFNSQQSLCCPAKEREPVREGKRMINIGKGKVFSLRHPILFRRDIVSRQSVMSQERRIRVAIH